MLGFGQYIEWAVRRTWMFSRPLLEPVQIGESVQLPGSSWLPQARITFRHLSRIRAKTRGGKPHKEWQARSVRATIHPPHFDQLPPAWARDDARCFARGKHSFVTSNPVESGERPFTSPGRRLVADPIQALRRQVCRSDTNDACDSAQASSGWSPCGDP
jgi:hypothetical protein